MIFHESKIRVRYSETDRMGYVYYGNYAAFFEVARVEMLRWLGVNYKELEDNGIALPVSEYTVKFLRPAFYDQLLTIKTCIREQPTKKIVFIYETFNENNDLINKASTTLVFVGFETGKPCDLPENLSRLFSEKFKPL